MKATFWLAADASEAERAAFGALDACLAAEGENINYSTLSHLNRVRVGERHYYVKVYHRGGRYLRRFVGASRARVEWRNFRWFAEVGINAPRVVAFGERRGLSTGEGVVVTEEVAGTRDLSELVRSCPDRTADRRWLDAVTDRLAAHVHTMHRYGFVHNDLKFRNVLADFSNGAEVYIIDSPLGRRLYQPMLERGKTRDLASLDRMARRYLSRTRRLRFFKRYHGIRRLAPHHRRQIARILGFFEGRE